MTPLQTNALHIAKQEAAWQSALQPAEQLRRGLINLSLH